MKLSTLGKLRNVTYLRYVTLSTLVNYSRLTLLDVTLNARNVRGVRHS